MILCCCPSGDNWESTAIFWPSFFMFITSALVFGFGADYKKPVWTNWLLTLAFSGLFILGSLALLLPENYFTRIFHVASEQFNYVGKLLIWHRPAVVHLAHPSESRLIAHFFLQKNISVSIALFFPSRKATKRFLGDVKYIKMPHMSTDPMSPAPLSMTCRCDTGCPSERLGDLPDVLASSEPRQYPLLPGSGEQCTVLPRDVLRSAPWHLCRDSRRHRCRYLLAGSCDR